jgi:hypothetical protein
MPMLAVAQITGVGVFHDQVHQRFAAAFKPDATPTSKACRGDARLGPL